MSTLECSKIGPGDPPLPEIHVFNILQGNLDNSMLIVLEIGHLSPAIDRLSYGVIACGIFTKYE